MTRVTDVISWRAVVRHARRVRRLALFVLCACGTSPAAPPSDAAIEKKVVTPSDGGAQEPPFSGPEHLADTHLYADFDSRTLSPGVIAYAPRYPLWSDGLEAKRWLQLPPSTQIDTSAMDDWVFPVGTKVWKELDEGGVAIETRMLWKTSDDEWSYVSYAWNADHTDAVAVPDGATNVLGTTHDIPAREDCSSCHDDVRDMLIGVSALQLGASDGDGTLGELVKAGALTKPPTATFFDVPGSGAAKEALGYLHGNCGSCHAEFGALHNQTQMRLRLLTTDTDPSLAPALVTSLCLVMKHEIPPDDIIYTIVPRNPDRSGLAVRMARRDSFAMPPVATKRADDAAVSAVRAWIATMGGSCALLGETAP